MPDSAHPFKVLCSVVPGQAEPAALREQGQVTSPLEEMQPEAWTC